MTDRLSVDADLNLDVDGVQVRVSGSGAHLDAHVGDVAGLMRALTAISAPAAVDPGRLTSAAADALADAGLQVTVQGPTGIVAEVGAGVDSRLGRLLTGSAHLRPRPDRALAQAALSNAVHSPAARRAASLGFAALAVSVGAAVLARRRR